jgi:hypothetical protein
MDEGFKVKTHLLDRNLIFRYPISPPSKRYSDHVRLAYDNLTKLLTREDDLIAFSNHSLKVFNFGRNHKLLYVFDIAHDSFTSDYRERLKGVQEKGGFITPFNACLDEKDNLVLAYFNGSLKNWELYRLDGTFIDNIKFPDRHTSGFLCFDRLGNIYRRIRKEDGVEIAIYRIK